MSDEITPVFHGEMQLAGWSETHTGGCKVTLWLPDTTDLDVFRAMTVRKGNMAGQRLAVAMVLIGDGEAPAAPPAPVVSRTNTPTQQAAPEPHPGPERAAPQQEVFKGLTRLAIEWCELPQFWSWLSYTWGSRPPVTNAHQAKLMLCELCGIESRKELNTDPGAAEYFNSVIRTPFSEILQSRRG